ncbi:MAG TPA: MBL fold metallo-hydrolase [Gemmatimonadaceae bacterium]|jgi:L-ascorbate metabolism protein UlaG (beta-lactamase superfamily)
MKVMLHATYIGGPTALLEVAGLRLLTDPTFDAAGAAYPTAVYTLRKTSDPAVAVEALGAVDAVLLSHDHHFDNLDRAGRELLSRVDRVLTTAVGAERLGGNALGLVPWQHAQLDAFDGSGLRVTATPARHGPPDADRGPVIGFLLSEGSAAPTRSTPAIYISGDTVWYDGLRAIAERADVEVAVLFVGAARVREVLPAHLTFTAVEAVTMARTLPHAVIVPLHYEGWAHFSEGRAEIQRAFDETGLADRLCWLKPGQRTAIGPDASLRRENQK